MGSYDSQYESYYANIQKNRAGGTYKNLNRKSKYINRFIQEIVGVFLLSFIIMFCKLVKTPQTVVAYNYMKKTVNYSINYKQAWTEISSIKYKDVEKYINKYSKKVDKLIKDGVNFQNKPL
ncbi:hypothetical protein [Clostridium oryzae]|uniref:Uncharacterized protein n=1 Tax=Clostridium oryzae TaxID=1450648 RepID=A0A1V4IUQ2_9CLOT|nr:hypothetical protein [Clostridium oryzae]OPJ63762.1 hypothetical protein CLORY_09460 [Clostridium oryzae]